MPADFSAFVSKYPRFHAEDASKLEAYFASGEGSAGLDSALSEIARARKTGLITAIVTFVVLFGLFVWGFWPDLELGVVVGVICSAIAGAIARIIAIAVSFKGKGGLFPGLAKTVSENMEYSEGSTLFSGGLSEFVSLDLLQSYDRVAKTEDSVRYRSEKAPFFTACGMEVITEKKQRTKNGERYVTNNHAYIFSATFENSAFPIDSTVQLLRQGADFSKRLVLFIAPIILIAPFVPDGLWKNLLREPVVDLVLFLILSAWGFFTLGRRSKRHIKLESPEFEKTFDVFGEELESRKLLTPAFMERAVSFVKNAPKKRPYEFAFVKNGFRMKIDLRGTGGVMELSAFGGSDRIFKDVVEFYLELKSFVALAEDLNLAYYAKKAAPTLSAHST